MLREWSTLSNQTDKAVDLFLDMLQKRKKSKMKSKATPIWSRAYTW